MTQENKNWGSKSDNVNIKYNVTKPSFSSVSTSSSYSINKGAYYHQNERHEEFLGRKVGRNEPPKQINDDRRVKPKNEYWLPSESISVLPKEKIIFYNMERDRAMSSTKFRQLRNKKNTIVPSLPRFFCG